MIEESELGPTRRKKFSSSAEYPDQLLFPAGLLCDLPIWVFVLG
jgi:hypothetical protein